MKKNISLSVLMILLLFVGGCSSHQTNATIKDTDNYISTNTEPTQAPSDNDVSDDFIDNLNFQYYDYTKEIGITESILEYKEHTAYSIYYPLIGVTEIDNDMRATIDDAIQDFNNEYKDYISSSAQDKAILHIDYDSYLVGENYASIALYINYYSSSLAHPDEILITKLYNLKTGELLSVDDIYQDSFLPFISSYVRSYFTENKEYNSGILENEFDENTAPTWENYQYFTLSNDDVTFYFDKYQLLSGAYGVPYVTLDKEKLASYLKIDLSGKIEVPENPLPPMEDIEIEEETTSKDRVIDPDKPMIALTYDDGPDTTITNRILDVLDNYNARATFFVIGNRVGSYPDTLQRIVELGNEVGNHSYSHPNLSKLDISKVKREIDKTNKTIEKITGIKPKYVRPPYGAYNNDIKKSIKQTIVLWSVDTLDWKTKNKDMIIEEALKDVKDGSVILMHGIYEPSAEASEYLIPELISRGYQLVTVSELLEYKPKAITVNDVVIGKR